MSSQWKRLEHLHNEDRDLSV